MKLLRIKDFGPVSEAEIEIKRFNLLIGEQSVGKSTIAKLITLFTDYLSLAALFSKKQEAWLSFLKAYDFDCSTLDNYLIEYTDETADQKITITIDPHSVQTHFYENGTESTTEKLRDRLTIDTQKNSLYIPAERNISSLIFNLYPALSTLDEQAPKTLSRFVLELNNAKEKYSGQHIDLLDVTYRKVDNKDLVVINNGKKEIPLRNSSSGMQSVIPLILAIRYGVEQKQYESFVIEEPECNLFPEKQVELLSFLISSIYSEERVLTITTHSPYLLSAMNNFIYASQISSRLSENGKESLKEIIHQNSWISSSDCAIYSLGESINQGKYCISIIDKESGLIDYNYLDGVSMQMGDIFSKMQRLYVRETRKTNTK